jgi:hypothetical protein
MQQDNPMLMAETLQGEAQEDEVMSEEDLQGVISAEITDAISFIDDDIGGNRALATEYYYGQAFGNEEDGRSQVVSMDVRDTVQGILPSLMRIFFGPERVVEFAPQGPEDVASAEQATDYVDFILKRDNPGFKILHSAFKDALVRKCGIIKYWWDESVEVRADSFSMLDEQSMMMLTSDPDIEISAVREYPMPGMEPQNEAQGIMTPPPMLYDVEIKRRIKSGKVKIEALPPEEFLIDRRAKSIEGATFVGHRTMKTVSDLVAMGYDYDEMVEEAGNGNDFDNNEEYQARNPFAVISTANNGDPSSKSLMYIEGYLKVDFDGDGIAELRRICTIGTGNKVVRNEIVSDRQFADFCPDPEPHTFFGMCPADVVMDIQRIKSNVQRGILDSLAQAINPRTAIVEGQANMDDVLNTEVGAVIRMRAPGMVQPFTTPFVGQAAFPMLEYLDDIKQTRTGISKAASGLDADALQSTTKAAVSATVNAAHQHIEMIARIFAETGLRKLFTGILKLITENQDKARMVRLRNTFVPIDPRSWDANMDVIVNVGVGDGTLEERIALLTQVATRQEQIIAQQGPSNPVVSIPQYTNTLAKMLQLAGIKDSQNYFAQLPADWTPPESPPPQPSPEEILAKVQAESIQADIQKKAAELQLDREKAIMADDRERDRVEQDGILRRYELELKYGVQIQSAEINAAMNRDREFIRQQAAMSQQAPMEQAQMSPQMSPDQMMNQGPEMNPDFAMSPQPQQPQPMM